MFKHALLLLIAVVAIPGCASSNANDQEAPKVSKPLSFTMKSLAGKDVDLSKYEGKVVLIVNVASKCGLTPQYEQLQALQDKFAEDGLAILGFPCNPFPVPLAGAGNRRADPGVLPCQLWRDL